jgi:hypothetical protein
MSHAYRLLVVVLALGLSAVGCATKVASITGTSAAVEVELNRKHARVLQLKSATGQALDKALPDGRKVRFDLPEPSETGAFGSPDWSIHAWDGTVLRLQGRQGVTFRNPAWLEYRARAHESRQSASTLQAARKADTDARSLRDRSAQRLTSNPAHKGGRCLRLDPATPPSRPALACAPGEARSYALALCALSTGASAGCEGLAQGLGSDVDSATRQFLTSGACSALVARLLDESASPEELLGEALGDAVIGGLDALGDSALDSENVLGVLFGAYVKATALAAKMAKFGRCLDTASARCSNAHRRWQQQVAETLQTPARLETACQNDLRALHEAQRLLPDLERALERARREWQQAERATEAARRARVRIF